MISGQIQKIEKTGNGQKFAFNNLFQYVVRHRADVALLIDPLSKHPFKPFIDNDRDSKGSFITRIELDKFEPNRMNVQIWESFYIHGRDDVLDNEQICKSRINYASNFREFTVKANGILEITPLVIEWGSLAGIDAVNAAAMAFAQNAVSTNPNIGHIKPGNGQYKAYFHGETKVYVFGMNFYEKGSGNLLGDSILVIGTEKEINELAKDAATFLASKINQEVYYWQQTSR